MWQPAVLSQNLRSGDGHWQHPAYYWDTERGSPIKRPPIISYINNKCHTFAVCVCVKHLNILGIVSDGVSVHLWWGWLLLCCCEKCHKQTPRKLYPPQWIAARNLKSCDSWAAQVDAGKLDKLRHKIFQEKGVIASTVYCMTSQQTIMPLGRLPRMTSDTLFQWYKLYYKDNQ